MPFETDKERSTMRSSLAEDGSKPETKLASFSGPPKQEALVAAAKSGEELAFEGLVKRHHPRIFALALRYTRVPEDAEDVVQQTFEKAFVYLHKFEGKSSFSTWLTRIAINEALMLLRRGRAGREVSIDGSNEDESAARSLEARELGP